MGAYKTEIDSFYGNGYYSYDYRGYFRFNPGVAAATKQNTWVDYTTTIISVIAVSVPSFVLAVLLQYVFAVRLRWFPVAGWEGFSTAVLPSLALSATVLATVARYIRAEMIEVLSSDYILLARAKVTLL